MSLEALKNDISKGMQHQVYLFFGPEVYLINYYLKKMKSLLIKPDLEGFNYTVLEGKDGSRKIIDNCETAPMLSDKKLVVVKEAGLFGSETKTKKEGSEGSIQELLAGYLGKLPAGVYLVFIENEISKKSKLYTAAKDKGLCIEFNYQGIGDLEKWVIKVFDSYDVRIDKKGAQHLLETGNQSMTEIMNEIKKLVDYVGQNNTVNIAHIDNVCIKPIQAKVFDMVDAVAQKNLVKAYRLLDEMLILKEPIQKINVLVIRQFKNLFFVKQMAAKGYPASKIAAHMDLHPYIINKHMKQCEKYSMKQLEEAAKDFLEMDTRIKSGKIDPRMALESLIAKYSA